MPKVINIFPLFIKNLLRCSWSADGNKVSAGSADRFVYIWDTTSRRIIYKLPGHNGSVNDVVFHPKEPIGNYPFFLFVFLGLCEVLMCLCIFLVASGASDKQIYLGEIEP